MDLSSWGNAEFGLGMAMHGIGLVCVPTSAQASRSCRYGKEAKRDAGYAFIPSLWALTSHAVSIPLLMAAYEVVG